MFQDIFFKENTKIFLSPFNDLTQHLETKLREKGVIIEGYFDSFKIGNNISKIKEGIDYDYVIIDSPNYFRTLVKNFDSDKIILVNNSKLILYKDYCKELTAGKNMKYDITFLPHNKAHMLDILPIINQLKQDTSYTIGIIDIQGFYPDEGASSLIKNLTDIDILPLEGIYLDLFQFRCFVCMNDWDTTIVNPLVKKLNNSNIDTIGIVEGITDFEDTHYSFKRNAYQTVKYVFTTGENDNKYLKNKETYIIGIPKIKRLYLKKPIFPEKIKILINVNFTYGVFEECREKWLEDVVKACEICKIDYVISQHHADKADLSQYNVSNKDLYSTLDECSLTISRFSTVILETIALGKPAVYYNPHGERIKLYQHPDGAFGIAKNLEELVCSIKDELKNKDSVRKRSNSLLDKQCNINSNISPEKLATNFFKSILK